LKNIFCSGKLILSSSNGNVRKRRKRLASKKWLVTILLLGLIIATYIGSWETADKLVDNKLNGELSISRISEAETSVEKINIIPYDGMLTIFARSIVLVLGFFLLIVLVRYVFKIIALEDE
jgi:hypothetical protein